MDDQDIRHENASNGAESCDNPSQKKKERRKSKCPICNREFLRPNLLIEHQRDCEVFKLQYKCRGCNGAFGTVQGQHIHEATCSKANRCPLCPGLCENPGHRRYYPRHRPTRN
ncbi:hypothetical protein BJ085DRAFT_32127 [Dimargaris cristalligena]|uniref:C2H2-type domain-containing protein n=1 Tax=Dimargaris cristalligena TaxID=215637 RepID=A0A4P9ZLN1_9FUNG|nr:hypothetical protein BJ085DRAFT_32127 [Dimargaris cristalligena]|eukprot:RKP34053.1 hypothetical protein BJ085DRAFT_32127 [Dimargaris cristalligena]